MTPADIIPGRLYKNLCFNEHVFLGVSDIDGNNKQLLVITPECFRFAHFVAEPSKCRADYWDNFYLADEISVSIKISGLTGE